MASTAKLQRLLDRKKVDEETQELPYIGGLPIETLLEIFSFLHPRELAYVSRLSTQYFLVAQDDQLWRPICLRAGFCPARGGMPAGGWKMYYKNSMSAYKKEQAESKKAAEVKPVDPGNARSTNRASAYRKGDIIILHNRPCTIIDLHLPKVGKHGCSKVLVTGIDIFLDRRFTGIFYLSDTPEFPKVLKTEHLVLGVDEYAYGTVDLLGESHTDMSVPVPPGALGVRLREYYQQEKDGIMATVLQVTWDNGNQHGQAIVDVRLEE